MEEEEKAGEARQAVEAVEAMAGSLHSLCR